MVVEFVSGRDGRPMTRVMGKISFPDRQSPTPKIGSVWEVAVSGSNAAGTVNFLRLVREISKAEIAAKAAKEAAKAAKVAAEEAAKKAAEEAAQEAAYAAERAAYKAAQEAFQGELEASPWGSPPGWERYVEFEGKNIQIHASRPYGRDYTLRAMVEMPMSAVETRITSVNGSEIEVFFPMEGRSRDFYSIHPWMDKAQLANCLVSCEFKIPEYSSAFTEEFAGRELAAHYLLSGWTLEKRVVSWSETSYSSPGEYEGCFGTKWDSGGETTVRRSESFVVIKSASGKSWREGHSYGVDSVRLPAELSEKFLNGEDIASDVQRYLEALRDAGKRALQDKVRKRAVSDELPMYYSVSEHSSELKARVSMAQKALDKTIAADLAAIERAFS